MAIAALDQLSRKLVSLASPPSLPDLETILCSAEDYRAFMRIVREFLPEIEDDVRRAGSPPDKMAVFATAFERRYFPLHPSFQDGAAEAYDQLVRMIPVMVLSTDWDDYHTIAEDSWQAGLQLATYLLADPYGEVSRGSRTPLAETCAHHVHRHLLRRVPEAGLGNEEVHKLLDGTKFEALATWSDMLGMCCGNAFTDNSAEQAFTPCPALDWTRENIDALTQQWLQAEVIQNKTNNLFAWIEEDPTGHLTELLDFIDDRRRELGKKPMKPSRVPKFKPRASDIKWVQDLVRQISMGGVWVAPAGFEFQKVGEREIKLTRASKDPRQHADAMELINRTVACGKAGRIKVNIDDLEKILKGGKHDADAGTTSAPVATAREIGSAARPAQGQARLL